MEKAVVSRLVPLVASGKLDRQSFFKTCALLGVSFTTAAAALGALPAGAEVVKRVDADQQGYSPYVPTEMLTFLDEARRSLADNEGYADQSTFVQKSTGTAFGEQPKFSEAPKFTKFVQAPTFGKFNPP